MAHFAELNDDNEVTRVIVVENYCILNENNEESEEIGIDYLHKIFGPNTKWKQTSYNNNFRGRYAGVGYTYDEELDIFIAPQSPYIEISITPEEQDLPIEQNVSILNPNQN